MKTKTRNLLSIVSIAPFIVILVVIYLLFSEERYAGFKVILTTILFFDIIPFALAITWFVWLYRSSTGRFGRELLDMLSIFSIIILPTAFYWAFRYDRYDKARMLPLTVAFIATIPFVLGLMWFAARYLQITNAIWLFFSKHPVLCFFFLLALIIVLRLLFEPFE